MSTPRKPAKRKNGYKMPKPLPSGTLLQDVFKKQWVLGPSIAKGGFGEIYSAQSHDSGSKKFPYVIKIEPHDNGPLFVEMHFYARNCKESSITEFKSAEKLKSLGIPHYIGSGSHTHSGEKFRFLVMEKFASDIWKLFKANNSLIPPPTVFKLALQMLDALHYIHSKGYVHADLKGANILLSAHDPNQAYLVDFGLASKFTTEKEFKANPKRMHDGTIEYLSRDAHQGVQTRRGDIEILAYNMIQWLTGKLPWEAHISTPDKVHKSKEDHMRDIYKFGFSSEMPKQIIDFLKYIQKLQFNDEPDYKKLKKLFLDGLKSCGANEDCALEFKPTSKRKSVSLQDLEENANKKKAPPRKPTRKTAKKAIEERTTSSEDEMDKASMQKPARRARRVNKIPSVEELQTAINGAAASSNGIVMNKEMMRIHLLAARKKVAKTSRRKITMESSSEEEEEEEKPPPISRRAMQKRVLNGGVH